MKQVISNLQLMFLTANFIFTSSIINLPRILVQTTGQYAWFVPIITFPLLLFIIVLFFKGENISLNNLRVIRNGKGKVFIFFFLLLAIAAFIRDLRGLIDFVASVLLPSTPVTVLMILSVLVITYMAMSELEVISRINSMHLVILTILVLLFPFLLLNKVHPGNMLPIPELNTAAPIMKAVYLAFAWMGEVIFFIVIISKVNSAKKAKKAVLAGTGLGLFLFFIIIFLEITVLGTKIVKEAAYPTYILIQQINFTDFFERIDLVIVAVWIPTIMTKLAYLLYVMDVCFSDLFESKTNKFLFPFSLALGLLTVLLFKNTMNYLQFSFYTWSSLGLILELIVTILFLFVKKGSINKANKPTG